MALKLASTQTGQTLTDLRLQIGDSVRVEIRSPRAKFTARLIGYMENGGIMISAPSANSGVSLLINEGNQASVRLLSGNRIGHFNSKILKRYDQPFAYWLLAYPQSVETKRIRGHSRVPVSLSCSIDDYDEMSERQGLPATALCVDISLSGLCLQLPYVLGEVGEHFYLTTRLTMSDIDQVLLVGVELRNVHHHTAELGGLVSHGFKFLELDEDSRLIIAAFVYQQFLVETGHLDQTGQE